MRSSSLRGLASGFLVFVAFVAGCGDPPAPGDVQPAPCGGACPVEECVLNVCVDPGGEDAGVDGGEDAGEPDAGQDADVMPTPCQEDGECEVGQICEQGLCVKGCREDAGCLDGEYCDQESLVCAAGCRVGECPEGEVCERESRVCQVVPCEDDGGCDVGQICEGGVCAEGCREDAGCGEGEICEEAACVPGCREDGECGEGEICEGEVCAEGCREDVGCGEGEICEDAACVSGCREDGGCDEGEICEEAVCVAGCRVDPDCAGGEICLETSCVAGCREDEGCAEGSYCDLEGLVCEVGCRIGDCPTGQVCVRESRVCEVVPCDDNRGCGLGQICEGEVCVEGCLEDIGCVALEICEGGQCVEGCRQDRTCGPGLICEGLRCEEGCRQDRDCGILEICRGDGTCGSRTCLDDRGCVLGTYCDGGSCLVGCRHDAECGVGLICAGANRLCVPGCRGDADCGEGEFCGDDQQCASGCRDDLGCGEGEICQSFGRQCGPGCRVDGDCEEGAFCVLAGANPTEGLCQPGCRLRQCPQGLVCDSEVRQCVEPTMCFGDDECGGGEICEPFFCQEGCRGDGECGPGLFCDDAGQFCRVGCRSDEGCGQTQYCNLVVGACLSGCRVGACGEGEVCDLDSRVCAPGPCEGDEDCDEDFFCEEGTGQCAVGCRRDGCPEGGRCDESIRLCLPGPCAQDGECGDGEICVAGACEEGCRSDVECLDGQFCRLPRGEDGGQCEVGCRVGGCPQGLECDTIQRFCVEPGCDVDEDCGQGQFCRDRVVCEVGCRDDRECGPGTICEDEVRQCTVGCRQDNDRDDACQQGFASPVRLSVGESVELQGRLCQGDIDHVGVRLEAGEGLEATLIPGEGIGALEPSLIGPDCVTVVAEAGFEGDPSRVGFRAPSAGVYVLRLAPARAFDTNDYTAVIRRLARGCGVDPEEPNEVGNGLTPRLDGARGEVIEVVDRNVCFGDEDWYAVPLDVSGDAIRVTLRQDAQQVPLGVEIRGVGDLVLAEAVEDAPEKTAVTGPINALGLYFIRVYATGPVSLEGVGYGLEVLVNADSDCDEDAFEPNDNPAEAVPLLPGVHAMNLCQGRDDAEWFEVEFVPGDRVRVSLTYDHSLVAPEESLSTTLFGPGGVGDVRDFALREGVSDTDTLAFAPDGFLVSEQDAGVWLLSVESGSGGIAVDFELSVEVEAPVCEEDPGEPRNERCEDALRVQPGQPLGGFLCGSARDEDWFVVSPDPNRGLSIRLEHLHFDGNLEMEAYAGDGVELLGFSYNAGPDFESIDLFPVPEGDVCVRVFTRSFSVTNAYTLSADLD